MPRIAAPPGYVLVPMPPEGPEAAAYWQALGEQMGAALVRERDARLKREQRARWGGHCKPKQPQEPPQRG